ncbi:MAG: agmatinase [bacterium]|nr:agmatinase [bacterium]
MTVWLLSGIGRIDREERVRTWSVESVVKKDRSPTAKIAVLSVPYDASSSFLKGASEGPKATLNALASASSNLCAENGIDLAIDDRWWTAGEVSSDLAPEMVRAVEERVASLLEERQRVVVVGGDHSISYPVLRAVAKAHADLTVLHLDAHPDLYDALEGNRLSHACPFARVMEEKLVARLIQIGIRTMNPHQREQAERFGVEVVEMKQWRSIKDIRLQGPLYLSIDVDCLDPAFAPGVSHHEPGGLTTREVIEIVQGLPAPLVGADIVELNPLRDVSGVTAMVSAKLLKEVLATMLDQDL